MTVRPGTVYLVGAGPGDPGLITRRGLELLQRADVVLHDRLIDDSLLEEAPESASIVDVGKASEGMSGTQAWINTLLVRHAQLGKVVVRLKGGDPFVFGRGWEERQACADAGVACEVVPGITSAIAGPGAADIPVTMRGVASTFSVSTATALDVPAAVAAAQADTAVFLMGVSSLPSLTARLIGAGKDPATPTAVIERATLPGQRVVRARLDEISEIAAGAGIRAPSVIVVGKTVSLCRLDEPLSGRRVMVTRPVSAAHELTQRLRVLGADIVFAPLIRITTTDLSDVTVLERLSTFDWIVFTSRHGVRGFRRALASSGIDARRLGHAKLATVGPVTSRELSAWGLRTDLEPDTYRADDLAAALLAADPPPRRVLFPCGTLARDVIPRTLSAHGIHVEPLTVYATTTLPLDGRARDALAEGVGAVLLASPSAAEALAASRVPLGETPIVCIGPTTAATARACGWPVVHVAPTHNDAGLVDCTLAVLGAEAAVC